MPTDVNGVYSLPVGYLAVTGTTIQPSQHNPPLEDIATALTARLSTNGANPMTGGIKGIDGAVGAPTYTFNTAQTTGFYKTSTGNIGVSIGGTETVEFGPSGVTKGGKLVGEVFAWTGTTAPALSLLPFGQTLSRTTYADLWTFAQSEIAAGSTLYNNGNGTTTFGIFDARGRLFAFKDNMGGSAAGRLTSTYFGAVTGATGQVLGGVGGSENISVSIAQTNLPNVTLTTSTTVTARVNTQLSNALGTTQALDILQLSGGGGTQSQAYPGTTSALGSGTAMTFRTVPPAIIVNCALFVGV